MTRPAVAKTDTAAGPGPRGTPDDRGRAGTAPAPAQRISCRQGAATPLMAGG